MVSDADEVAAALRDMVPSYVRVGVRTVSREDRPLLHASERQLVSRAVPARVDEFATGRVLLRQLTGSTEPILRRADRAPIMPTGWVGSLAHDGSLVISAVADSAAVAAIGVDIESIVPIGNEVEDVVIRPDDAIDDALLAHVAKESVFKAWAALNEGILEYRHVRMRLDGRRFNAVVELSGAEYTGTVARAAGRWLAAVVM